jgi:hypothetical protein
VNGVGNAEQSGGAAGEASAVRTKIRVYRAQPLGDVDVVVSACLSEPLGDFGKSAGGVRESSDVASSRRLMKTSGGT